MTTSAPKTSAVEAHEWHNWPAPTPSAILSRSAVSAALWLITFSASLAVVLWMPARTWLVFVALALSTTVSLHRLTPPLQFFSLLFLASFLLFPALAEAPSAEEGATVVIGLFLLGFLGGARLASRTYAPPARHWEAANRLVPVRSLLLVAAAGLLVRVLLTASGQVGLQAQYSSGSSESGPLALVASIGAACAAAAFWAIRSQPPVARYTSLLATALVLGHALSLAFSGFRGAGPSYLILVWIIGGPARRRLSASLWSPKRLVGPMMIVALGISLFLVGAVLREGYAAAAGKTSAGTQGLPTLKSVIDRLDGRSAFEVAYTHRDDSLAHRAVDPRPQVAAAIPRILFPDKPVVDYGRQVAYAFYGIPYAYRTSSTVTFLGDLYINVGTTGVFLLATVLGFALQRLLERLMAAMTGLSYALTYIVSAAVLRIESPVILNAVAMLRQVVFLVLLLAVVRLIASVSRRGSEPGQSGEVRASRRPSAFAPASASGPVLPAHAGLPMSR